MSSFFNRSEEFNENDFPWEVYISMMGETLEILLAVLMKKGIVRAEDFLESVDELKDTLIIELDRGGMLMEQLGFDLETGLPKEDKDSGETDA